MCEKDARRESFWNQGGVLMSSGKRELSFFQEVEGPSGSGMEIGEEF